MADYWKEVEQPPALPGSATPTTEFLVPSNAKLVRQMRTAAGWLFAYAACTIGNLLLSEIRAPLRLIVSMISAEYVSFVGRAVGGFAAPLGIVGAGVIVGLTALFGFFAYRFATWAFWAGLVTIAVDAFVNYSVTTLGGLWPFIIHLVALWFLFLGLKASRIHAARCAAKGAGG